jgi:hypothetical protein
MHVFVHASNREVVQQNSQDTALLLFEKESLLFSKEDARTGSTSAVVREG